MKTSTFVQLKDLHVRAYCPDRAFRDLLPSQQASMQRLLPPAEVPKLFERVLIQSHLHEINAVLEEAGLLVNGAFLRGNEHRCRTSISQSFCNFPEIVYQVRLWFSRGFSWSQIQSDLLKTFATPRDVRDAYMKSLAKLQYGPDSPNACRDLFVVHQERVCQRPHLLFSFMESVVEKLPEPMPEAVVRKLADEANDSFWQEARPFWSSDSTHTVIALIQKRMQSDAAIKDLKIKQSKPPMVSSGGTRDADSVLDASTCASPQSSENEAPSQPATPQDQPATPKAPWLDNWVSTQPSSRYVETGNADLITDLSKKVMEVKGPFRRFDRTYYVMSFERARSLQRRLSVRRSRRLSSDRSSQKTSKGRYR
jgi:hypothetical protein